MSVYLIDSKFSNSNLKVHKKHLNQYSEDFRFKDIDSSDESQMLNKYNEISDWLSSRTADKSRSFSRFVGYIDNKGRYCKYDRKNLDFVIYKGKYTISMYKITYPQYLNKLKRRFKSELPNNQ